MNFDRYRRYTQARIGLGHSGPGLPTKEWLSFALDHARAIDAIKIPWDLDEEETRLHKLGCKTTRLATMVKDREEYLLRPDLGRCLNERAKDCLRNLGGQTDENIVVMASNGLSSLALINHLEKFLKIVRKRLQHEGMKVNDDRIYLVPNGRVGLIDDLGEILKPTLGVVLIGERPGLSSPDSLAAYITYKPHRGLSDADRNCISNIRPPHGLGYEEAAGKLLFILKEARSRKLTGIALKEEMSNVEGLASPKGAEALLDKQAE